MIPVKLSLEGIYSYQSKQTIDFSQLTDAGLFGVFGAVGSGKSSILEAITFALFGNSDRLGSNGYAYHMMNLKSNRLWIEFEFINFENKHFKIVREYKRNGKQFDKVLRSDVVLYEWLNENWIPKESSDVEPVIGLSSENFRRTIIIPQGQFREFIELKPKDRTQMMKEIFNLHQYDLQNNASLLASQNQKQLDQLEGQLKGFEAVSEAEMEEVKAQQVIAQNLLTEKQELFNASNERFNRLKNLKAELQEWKVKQQELVQLQEQEEQFRAIEVELTQFERIQTAFHALLQDKNRVETELQSKNSILANKKMEAERSIELEKQLAAEFTALQPKKDGLEQLKLQLKELEWVQKITHAKRFVSENASRLKEGDAYILDQKERETVVLKDIDALEKEIASLGQQQLSTVDLVELDSWYKHFADLQTRITGLEQKLEVQLQAKPSLNLVLESYNLTADQFETQLIQHTGRVEAQKRELEEQKNQLEVKRQLSHYAHNLTDGHACPLCGSLEHPSVAEMEDVSAQMEEVKRLLNANDEEGSKWKKAISEIEKKEQEIQIFESRLKEEQTNLEAEKAKKEQLLSTFRWNEFSALDASAFELKKQAHYQNEALKNEKEDQLKIKRQEVLNFQQNVEKAKAKIQDLQMRSDKAKAESETLLEMLHHLNYTDFEHTSDDQITLQAKSWQQTIQEVEAAYDFTEKKWTAIKLQISAEQASVKEMEVQLAELKQKYTDIEQALVQRLAAEELNDLQVVQEILNKKIDVAGTRTRVENFRVQLLTVKEMVTSFEKKLNGVELDEEVFQKEEEAFRLADEALKLATQDAAKLEDQLNRLVKLFEEKRELLEQYGQLKKRGENLSEMKKLFTAAGFVEYVASIYLQQLCDHANQRFHRMTRNQLSLQINNGGFEIVDYLNDGKSRSVKTLSGGQAFQVSLCLALALAESVQANSKANRNFFFIDEGFGTQDSDSVNIVFETLQSLVKENRIVGIISHVEELKERMPISIQVEKDAEKGSVIEIVN